MNRFGLIGQNVQKSLSPQIHNYIYQHIGVSADYCLISTNDIYSINFADFNGFNVTTPYKCAILSRVDKDLSFCGSVNTLKVLSNKTIEGHSTDGRGFVLDACRLGLDLSRVLIFGHGGAAKSIMHQLQKLGSLVNIFSTNKKERAFSARPTLSINCTGHDCDFVSPCYDLRYLNWQAGAIGGLGMLIYQAILSNEIFFNKPIDLSIFDYINAKLCT